MAKRETLEEVIRMSVRVQAKLRKEGIKLRWTVQFEPDEDPYPSKPAASSTSDRGDGHGK